MRVRVVRIRVVRVRVVKVRVVVMVGKAPPPHHGERARAHAALARVRVLLPRDTVLGRLVLLPRGIGMGIGSGSGFGVYVPEAISRALTLTLTLTLLTCHEL